MSRSTAGVAAILVIQLCSFASIVADASENSFEGGGHFQPGSAGLQLEQQAQQSAGLIPVAKQPEPPRSEQWNNWSRLPENQTAPPEFESINPAEYQDLRSDLESISPIEPIHDGGAESGELEEIVVRYPNGQPQIVRYAIRDHNDNFLTHGLWQLFNRQGEIVAEGMFDRGRMNGEWRRWHARESAPIFQAPPFTRFSSPFLSVATFENGRLHGTWMIYDRYERIIMELSYADGQRNGIATWFWPHGGKAQEIVFRHGRLDGPMREYDSRSRTSRQEYFEDGRRLIQEISFWHGEQKRSEDHYLDAKLILAGTDDWWNAELAPLVSDTEAVPQRDGPSLAWHENGQLKMRGEYRDGQRQGRFVWWHANGMKQLEGNYISGSKIGLWQWWHDNGQKSIEGHYDHDQPQGFWVWWSRGGELVTQESFDLASPALLPALRAPVLHAD